MVVLSELWVNKAKVAIDLLLATNILGHLGAGSLLSSKPKVVSKSIEDFLEGFTWASPYINEKPKNVEQHLIHNNCPTGKVEFHCALVI